MRPVSSSILHPLRIAFVVAATLASAADAVAEASESQPPPVPADAPYKNPDLPMDVRVRDLIGRMTLEEKASQLEVQSAAIPRLGVPTFQWWSEGIHGMARAGAATQFPQAIALAATWDPELVQRIASATASEARAKLDPAGTRYRGISIWAPCVNLTRDPRWGRIEEAYGEDPHLVSRLGVAFVRGLQGDHPTYLKTVAAPKHLAVHSQETGRAKLMVNVSDRLLHEYYLPAFRATVVEGKAASMMAAFSGVRGYPCSANRWLLTEMLRQRWGFEGAVVSDWGGVRNLQTQFGLAGSEEEAVAMALAAGLDVPCNPKPIVEATISAVNKGLLSRELLDRALYRSLMLRFRLGTFDPPERVPYATVDPAVVGSLEHRKLALEAATKCFVLLKNEPIEPGYGFDRLLPLSVRELKSIAVIGPYADVLQTGAYSGTPSGPAPTPLQAIDDLSGDRVRVLSVKWGDFHRRPERPTVEQCVKAASEADVAIVIAGLNNRIEREGNDRPNTDLPREQLELIQEVLKANPATIVVLQGGSPMAINWLRDHVPAILLVWYPGEVGSISLARTLFGQYNPSGRLPMTWYLSDADLTDIGDYDITKGRTYLYLRKPPLYPFGFGLSYSAFDYQNLRLERDTLEAGDILGLSVEVANRGPMDGDEVVQCYVRDVESDIVVPLKQLRGFARVTIPAGQSRTVTLSLPVGDWAYWDEKTSGFVVAPGEYEVMVGASSADIRLRRTVRVR